LNAWQVNGTYSGLSINSSKWEINRHYYFENSSAIPSLVKLYRAQNTSALAGFINYTRANENGGFDPISNVYPIKLGLTVEIVFQIIGAKGDPHPDTHPWHMHGSNFYDMGVGPGEFTEKAFQAQLCGRRPIQRDTTLGYTKAGEFTHAPFNYQGVYPLHMNNVVRTMKRCPSDGELFGSRRLILESGWLAISYTGLICRFIVIFSLI
jgi:hypothetical protein